MADDDARDERLGAMLEVEPLDDLTRHRLVTNAVRTSRPSRTVRWVVAAVVALLLVAGGALLFLAPGSHDDRQSATPVRTPAEAKGAAAPDAAASTPSAATVAGPPVELGDFGDLSHVANRDRIRQAPALGAGSTFAASGSVAADSNDPLVAELTARGCRAALPQGVITAVGTGTLAGARAIVVVTAGADGTRSFDVAVGDPCAVKPLP